MCVSINYKGRLGNNLFQYSAARLFAEKFNLPIITEFPKNNFIQPVKKYETQSACCKKRVIVDDTNWIKFFAENKLESQVEYNFDGWFQQASIYYNYRNRIREWFAFYYHEQKSAGIKEDIVAHFRLKDYKDAWVDGSRIISPEWYLNILKQEKFEKLTIVTDEPDNINYLKYFSVYSPRVEEKLEANNFYTLASYSRVLMANSTFSWWACFLGCCEKAYTFKPWVKDIQISLTNFPGAVELEGEFWDGK